MFREVVLRSDFAVQAQHTVVRGGCRRTRGTVAFAADAGEEHTRPQSDIRLQPRIGIAKHEIEGRERCDPKVRPLERS